MFTLTRVSSPFRSSAIFSSTGETAWQGPHHSAQKSTKTAVSLLSTSFSKVASVTFNVISTLGSFLRRMRNACGIKRLRLENPSLDLLDVIPSGAHLLTSAG